ncbi:MAG: pro-sigmaK processing inhibitor BofA family protein [Anaeroplasmataceae bacterium]
MFFSGENMKLVKYILKSLLIGISSLLLINFLGQFIGYNIPINLLSIILIGFFHLPGFLVLLIILIL